MDRLGIIVRLNFETLHATSLRWIFVANQMLITQLLSYSVLSGVMPAVEF